MRWREGVLIACATLSGGLLAAPAAAQVCGPRIVTATGATAQLAIIGRVAARAAWASKVAADPRLGSNYSTWLRGRDRRLVCRKVERRHLCLAIALPCRAGKLGATAPAAQPPGIPNAKQRPL